MQSCSPSSAPTVFSPRASTPSPAPRAETTSAQTTGRTCSSPITGTNSPACTAFLTAILTTTQSSTLALRAPAQSGRCGGAVTPTTQGSGILLRTTAGTVRTCTTGRPSGTSWARCLAGWTRPSIDIRQLS